MLEAIILKCAGSPGQAGMVGVCGASLALLIAACAFF